MSDPESPPGQGFALPSVRRVSLARPRNWLKSGWHDMRSNPVTSLSYGLLFGIAGAVVLIFSWSKPYLFTAAVSGFILIAPLLAGGLYEISRRQAEGQPATLLESLDGWRRNGQSMAMFGLLLALVALVWERTSAVISALLVPGMAPDLSSFIFDVLLNPEFAGITLAWFMVGTCLAILVFAVSAVSIPVLIDRDVDFVTAMITSLRATVLNPDVMFLWAVLVVTLTLAGFATLLLGLVLTMPLLGHASWHAYQDLVEK